MTPRQRAQFWGDICRIGEVFITAGIHELQRLLRWWTRWAAAKQVKT